MVIFFIVLTKIRRGAYFAEMAEIQHLTTNQLTAYSTGSVKGEEKHQIGRHLLFCDECRKRMPPPTVEMFWKALMTDEPETDEE